MIFECVSPDMLSIDMRELSARLSSPLGADIEGGEQLYNELISVAKPSYVSIRVKLNRENDAIIIGNTKTKSASLNTLCRGCEECILLVATIGVGVDRLIMRTASLSPREAFILDAMSDALIEALCDYAEAKITAGLDTTGRFSPGYGDLELSFGRELLSLTDSERTLGIKQTASGMMVPKKSVNAIIAIRNS